MKRIDKIYNKLKEICAKQYQQYQEITGVSASELSEALEIHRTNVSSELNKLIREEQIEKIKGRPVLYRVKNTDSQKEDISDNALDKIIGSKLSLKNAVQQAKSAVMYPPRGLHILLHGETGTGKSMFAETIYHYAKEIGKIKGNGEFVSFNCADYAHNPQLLMSQLFGVKKGSYTGADRDRKGLVEKANGGILFLDEVHRLPPEGQEILFHLIDKGLYRKLGETETENKAEVLIICATTENIESSLLKTFTRRIPMLIHLPSIKERTPEERFELINFFLRNEGINVASDITMTSNALKGFLLYDCPQNIGQLKSDIKLSCANAFLESKMRKDTSIVIHSEDLPEYVRRGLFKYRENKDKIDKFVIGDLITFSIRESSLQIKQEQDVFNLYDTIDKKMQTLELKGLDPKDIKLIMSLEIEKYVTSYVFNVERRDVEDLYKVVDKEIVKIVDEFLTHAEQELHREFHSKIFYGLSMHIASAIERIRSGKVIHNPQLEEIKKNYGVEFSLSRYFVLQLQEIYSIEIPEAEVGFITMFLTLETEQEEAEGKVGILVMMHGESTASSMVAVANKLLGETQAVAYDVSLSEKYEDAFEKITGIVKQIDTGKGVLLLVDMSSLVFFGNMLQKKTGIEIKVVEMVSTPMVIEASRKAMLKASLEEVYRSVTQTSPYVSKMYKEHFNEQENIKENIIITACTTGEGTAMKLKSILDERYNLSKNNIDILPINIYGKKEFKRKIQDIKAYKNILAVVSAVNPEDDTLLYLSVSDIFDKQKLSILDGKIHSLTELELLDTLKDDMKKNFEIDFEKFVAAFKSFYNSLLNKGVYIHDDILIGLMLHIACGVERIVKGDEPIPLEDKDALIEAHPREFGYVKKALKNIESAFHIRMGQDERARIMKMIYCL